MNRDFPRFEMPPSVNVYTDRGEKSRGMKAGLFALGLAAGAVTLANWRGIVKKGLPLGLKLKTAVMRSAEDLSDMIREAQEDFAAADQAKRGPQ
ncbi:MAG: hypothetical protein ACT4OM_13565 [Actinomycetota bacterium]